jgi:hypothetical protein
MQTTWDLNQLNWEPPGANLYLLFLLLVWIFGAANMFRMWRATKRIRARAGHDTSSETRIARTSNANLSRGMSLTFLCLGLFVSFSLGKACTGLLLERTVSTAEILLIVRGYAAFLTLTLLTITIITYVLRWYLLKRIEALEN